MQPTETKRLLLYYAQPNRVIKAVVIVGLLLVFLYFYIGRMTFILWLLSIAFVIALVQAVKQMFDRAPLIIINDEGINDKRLGMGLIRWSDIESVRMHGLGGGYFISLELSNKEQYLARQSTFARLSSQIWRLYNISPINIKVAYMDVTPDELFELIMTEVEQRRSRS